jgi:hypothetical protein
MSLPEQGRLESVFSNDAIREFGATLRRALRENNDYASLMDFEFAETPEAFAEALHRFLRRYESFARKEHRRRPSENSLKEITKLVDLHGVQLVRAALISHALCRAEREEVETGGEQ